MIEFSDLNRTEPITRQHDRKTFSSGVSKLDNYLRDRAIGDTEKNVSRTFVLTLKERSQTIIGYYSLSALHIPFNEIPEEFRKKLPNYKIIGTTLIGKLAVGEEWQHGKCNLRLGEHLLIDAMRTAWRASQQVASYALVVDILIGEKGDPTQFYLKNGFIAFRDNSTRLFLPMDTIELALRQTGNR